MSCELHFRTGTSHTMSVKDHISESRDRSYSQWPSKIPTRVYRLPIIGYSLKMLSFVAHPEVPQKKRANKKWTCRRHMGILSLFLNGVV